MVHTLGGRQDPTLSVQSLAAGLVWRCIAWAVVRTLHNALCCPVLKFPSISLGTGVLGRLVAGQRCLGLMSTLALCQETQKEPFNTQETEGRETGRGFHQLLLWRALLCLTLLVSGLSGPGFSWMVLAAA